MAIDITNETIVGLTEATKILPRVRGRRAAISTLWRWCRKGLWGVHLEYIRVGRNIATSREALNRFFAALAKADGVRSDAERAPGEGSGQNSPRVGRPGHATTPSRPPFLTQPNIAATAGARQRALAEADRILAEAGI